MFNYLLPATSFVNIIRIMIVVTHFTNGGISKNPFLLHLYIIQGICLPNGNTKISYDASNTVSCKTEPDCKCQHVARLKM